MKPAPLRRALTVTVAAATVFACSVPAVASAAKPIKSPKPDFTLTILHANDLESSLLPVAGADGSTYGGADRFVELIQQQQRVAEKGKRGAGQAKKRGVLTISAGDNFLPGPQLAASEESGEPIYDATAFSEAGFDVSILGNHDFDQTPEFLAEWLGDVSSDTKFVAGNLGFKAEPSLLAYVKNRTIVSTHVEKIRGEKIGIIGLTTPELPRLTSSDDVTVDPDLAKIANAQAAAYKRAGVDKVVLVSHLQDIDNEVALAGQLRGVDIIVGGGGHELLANPGDPLVANGASAKDPFLTPAGTYPLLPKDANGKAVPVVTTNGLYSYVGRLVVTFDAKGQVLKVHDDLSRPLPVLAAGPGSVQPDRKVLRDVIRPVEGYVEALAEEILATTEVPLNGLRNDIRSKVTNLGNLVTDSLLAAGRSGAAEAGVTAPVVAFQNGGGIRNASVIPAGGVSALDTYRIVPFSNFVSVAPAMPVATFIAGVEHGLSGAVTDGMLQPAGNFLQAAGYRVTYDPAEPAGSRIVNLTLDSGTVLVANGQPTGTLPTISVATIDFLLRGGDGFPFDGVDFTVLPSTQQQGFETYLVDELGKVISEEDYPVGGEGRIVPLS